MRPARLATVVALLAALAPWGAAHAQKPQRAERPTLQVGDKWIRSDGLYDLVRIEDDQYVFSSGPGRDLRLTRDLTVAFARRGDKVIEFHPGPKLGWPLEVGKSGWQQLRARLPQTPGTVGFPATYEWKVEALETVEVAGASLDAFRVAFGVRMESPRGGTQHRRWVLWYAPEARQWVKSESPDVPALQFAVVALDRQAPTPLAIVLRAPRDEEHLTAPLLALEGKATGGRGVARVTVSVNGAEIALPPPRAPEAEIPLNVPLKLREGRNVILVTAAEPGGATRQEARVVFFDRPVAVAPPAAPGERRVPPVEPRGEAPRPAPPGAAAPPAIAAPPPVVAPPSRLAPVVPPPAMALAPPPPLQVALTSPRDQVRVEQETIALAGVASGGHGVARVTVTLNGIEIGRVAEAQPRPALPVNLPLKLAEGANTLVVTVSDAAGAVHQEVRTVVFEKRVPLTVAVRYPQDGARVTDEGSVIAAVVASSKGVASVRVTLNGQEVGKVEERTPQKSLVVSVPITLRAGANAVALIATDADGTVQQELRTVVYDAPRVAALPPPGAAPPPPPAPKALHNQWAVVIGVGKYEAPSIPTLQYTVPDAESIYQTLTGPAGFKKDHVLLLTDKGERKPTLRNIKWALGTFLGRSAQKDDTVVIYYAGHGAPEVDTRGVERDGLAKYLIPSDADPDDLYSTALPMDELQTIFGRIEAERVVVFLDACYSGAAGGRTFLAKKTRAGAVDDLFLERLTRSKGRAIITASRPSEVSIELPDLGHGIFTYYMVQGLKGAADLNRDGIVTLQELYEYLEQQVTQKSRAVGGNQHPVMKGELEGVLPLVKVGK
jgi:hypothetical protein